MVILILLLSSQICGQNLFLVGERSFSCTETYTLESNSDEFYINDLKIVFGKNGETSIIGLSTKTENTVIRGTLIIYLEDGAVISLADTGIYDYVDKIAYSVYYLSYIDLEKIKTSNILKIRYTLEKEDGLETPFGGNFSASNTGRTKIDFHSVVGKYYD